MTMTEAVTLVDGELSKQLAVSDRGLQYGDGLFTTLAVRAGEPLLWPRHRARLDWACARLMISAPDWLQLAAEVRQLAAHQERAVIKIILTRGQGQRGYRPAAGVGCRRIISRYPWPQWPAANWYQGIRVRACDVRLAAQPRLAGIKHLNRLEQVLARAEWRDPAIAEGLLFDAQGRPVSGTMTNLWLLKDGLLLTPLIVDCGILGVLRGRILELAHSQGIACQSAVLTTDDLLAAEEVFFSNALIGIWPAAEVCGRQLPRKRPVSSSLLTLLMQQQAINPPPEGNDERNV